MATKDYLEDKVVDIVVDEDALAVRSDEINVKAFGNQLSETILMLKNTIRANNLASLSAIQIGRPERVFCINFNGDIRSFVNPAIIEADGIEISKETCVSIPGKEFIRLRNSTVTVAYQTPLGKMESRKMVGLAARICQHEIDHLDGILLTDVGLEIDEDFEHATEDERREVIKAYIDSLDVKLKAVQEDIEKDEDAKKLHSAIDFMEKVQKGEVKLENVPVEKKQEKKGEE